MELECYPYSVGHHDEGVCILVRLGGYRILLDCGLADLTPLIQGTQQAPFDWVICSHAHSDHARGLLALHQQFPHVPIYTSEVTARLLPLNWLDQAPVDGFCRTIPWRSPTKLRHNLSIELWPAGHLPGASGVLITYVTPQRTYKVFYTGDFLLSSSRLVEGFPLEELRGLKPDVLILEGSYGTSRHPHRRQQENQLADRIQRAIANHQSVLLPTSSLGLGQEILMLLRSHHHFTGRDLDIWVDGSVALGCDAYLDILPHLPSTVQNFARHQPLFWDERVRPRVRRFDASQWQTLHDGEHPCIVLCDRSADFRTYCTPKNGSWLILLPEQPGQIGSTNLSNYSGIQVSEELQTQIYHGDLTVDTYLLGEHCDGMGTTQLIHNLRPQHVVFVHGIPSYLTDLTCLEELQNRYHLHSPTVGVAVEMPIGETFHQPAPPEVRYEGELTELETMVMVTLPDAVTLDSRWQQFADTGLIEARWQGESLVIRGIAQRELLSQSSEASLTPSFDCCENCQFCRGQRCWNKSSPLFGFKVTPEGYCPAFQAIIPQGDRLDSTYLEEGLEE
jgi:Cft2 family RNA processing exonuclease